MAGSSSRRDVAYVDAQIELDAGDIELDFLLEARRKRGYRLGYINRMMMMKAQWCAVITRIHSTTGLISSCSAEIAN